MKLLMALSFLFSITTFAATKAEEAVQLVNQCDSHEFFVALPFSRNRADVEAKRAQFKELLAQTEAFEFSQDSFTTVRFVPKQGIGLNQWKIGRAMRGLLGEMDGFFLTANGSESGGVFCVSTVGLSN